MDILSVCWICGGNANSREHIFKKSLMKKFLGKHSYPYHVPLDGRRVRKTQGVNSKTIKYKTTICAVCNNNKSKEWDKAYSTFAEGWCLNCDYDEINFVKIYGNHYRNNIRNLHCYFAKSLGCRIIDSGAELPDNFPNPLSLCNMPNLKISIHKNQSPLFLSLLEYNPKIDRNIMLSNALGKGDLLANISKTQYQIGKKKVIDAIWWENINNFQINYWLNREPDPRFGTAMKYNIPIYKAVRCDLNLIEMYDYMKGIL